MGDVVFLYRFVASILLFQSDQIVLNSYLAATGFREIRRKDTLRVCE